MEILATACPKSTAESCIKVAFFSIYMLINKMRGLGVWGPFFPFCLFAFQEDRSCFFYFIPAAVSTM